MKAIFAALMRLATFALTVGAGTIVGLLAIPVITGVVGSDAWAIQVLVQSLATLFGVLVAFGWGTVGPGMVASTESALRPQLFLDSFVTRGYLFLLAAPLMVAFMIILQPKDAAFVAIASVAYLLPYLGASWYFVGEARPMRLFLVDALPQLAGTIVGLVVLVVTRDFTLLVTTQLLFNLGAVVLSTAVVLSGSSGVKADLSLRTSLSQMATQRHGVITAATGSLYVNLPILVVKVLLPDQLDAYALADRLFRFAVTAFSPVLQFIQGWIPEGGLQSMAHRIHRASQLTPMLGLTGGIGLAALGPVAADVLVRGTTEFGLGLSIPIGFSFAAVAVSQVLGLACLVSLGRSRELAKSTVIGAIIGAPLILVGAFTNGVVGVAWGVAVSEVAVAAFQFLVLRRYFGSLK